MSFPLDSEAYDSVILAQNYVPESLDPSIVSFWNKLYEGLLKQNRLFFVLSSANLPGARFPFLVIPYQVSGFASQYPQHLPKSPAISDALVERVSLWETLSTDDAAGALAIAQSYLSDALDWLRPALVIGWQSMHMNTQVLYLEAKKRQIPVWHAERGWLKNTMMFDCGENNFLSELNLSPTLSSIASGYHPKQGQFAKLSSYYSSYFARARYGNDQLLSPVGLRTELALPEDARLLVLFTHNEPSLHALSENALGPLHDTSSASFDARIREIVHYCERASLYLLIQEHPLNRSRPYV